MGDEVRNCGNCRYKDVPRQICHTCIVVQKPRLPYWAAYDEHHPEEEINIHLEGWDDGQESTEG